MCPSRHPSLVCLAGGADHGALFLSDLRPKVRLHRRLDDGTEGTAAAGRELLGRLSPPGDTRPQNLSRALREGDTRPVGADCHAAAADRADERRRMTAQTW